MLALRVIALWVVIGSVTGFIWGAILGAFDSFSAGLISFCGSIGLIQGVVGGILQSTIIAIRKKKWLIQDWLLYGLIAVFPFFVFLFWIAAGKAGNAMEEWFVPLQVLVCSYLTADLVNREIANVAPLS